MKKKTCYVTTPIYYASGNVHIGNSYTTIACDAYARFYRSKGYDTFYLTGMDEHGQKIEEAAKAMGITPRELTDKVAFTTKKLWRDLDIDYDHFIRTTDPGHVANVQRVFEKLLKSGDIYLGRYEGDYCVSCEAYFTKMQIGEKGICPDCGKPLRRVSEECYFLRLSKYAGKLLEFISDHPDFIEPESRRHEVLSFIESGLEDLCVSRTAFSWGIPVESNPRHIVYVWIDALLNYLSALHYGEEDDEAYRKYWVNGDKVIHAVGKDILRFHAVYWPIMLMALGVPIKFKLYVHGWMLVRGGKMSKSAGNIVYPHDITDRYGLDALRYYLLRELPLGNDAVFSYERFISRYNADLANDLGNLLSRTTSMISKYFGGSVVSPSELKNNSSIEVSKMTEDVIKDADEAFGNFRFQNGLREIWNLIGRANKYIDETMPWIIARDKERRDELSEVMYVLYEVLRNTAILLMPALPETSGKMFRALAVPPELRKPESAGFGKYWVSLSGKSEPLFVRLDPERELSLLTEGKNNDGIIK